MADLFNGTTADSNFRMSSPQRFGGVDEMRHLLERCPLQKSVVEVEDVVAAACLCETVCNGFRDRFRSAVCQKLIVHVSLKNAVGCLAPGVGEVNAGTHAEDRCPALEQQIKVGKLLGKQDRRSCFG